VEEICINIENNVTNQEIISETFVLTENCMDREENPVYLNLVFIA